MIKTEAHSSTINSKNWALALNTSLEAGWTYEKIVEALSLVVESLDALTTKLQPEIAKSFLLGYNVHLYGARPIDALWGGKKSEVFECIEVKLDLS